MELVRAGQHAFGHRVGAGDHQVVAGYIELLDGERHQRQVAAIARARKRQPLDERGGDWAALQEGALLGEVDQAEHVRPGKAAQDLLEHPLGAGVRHQPVMDHCDFHLGSLDPARWFIRID
ncbi:hypothetical protein D3C87_1863100 [compost metagenome]